MLRHRQRRAAGRAAQCRRASWSSSRSYADIIYREELERLGSEPGGPGIVRTLTRSAAGSRRTTPPRAPIRFCQKRLQLFDQA